MAGHFDQWVVFYCCDDYKCILHKMRGQINAHLTFPLNQAWIESTWPAHH